MALQQMKWKLVGIVALAGVALLGVEACGGTDAPLPPVDGTSAAAGSTDFQAIAEATMTVSNGHLTIGPVTTPAESAPGLATQGFGPVTTGRGLIGFSTGTDGVHTGTCTTSQYCAQITTSNLTGRIMDNTYVEITDYFTIVPAGTPVTWAGAAVSASNTYTNVFTNSPASAAFIGTMATAGTSAKEFKWNIGVTNCAATHNCATLFQYHVKVYGSFRRTTVGSSFQQKAAAADACLTGTMKLTQTDDGETSFPLPFAFTLYDITYDNIVLGANGYVLFYSSGSSAPTQTFTNGSLLGTLPIGLYPFWDDLLFTGAGNGVCVQTTGATPNRTLTITWKNAHINTVQPTKPVTPSAQTITFSLILTESTDAFTFAYTAPTGTISDLTRGLSATTGEHEVRGGGQTGVNYSFNADSAYIPAASTSYPTRLFRVTPEAALLPSACGSA